jgi:hypothetical protein
MSKLVVLGQLEERAGLVVRQPRQNEKAQALALRRLCHGLSYRLRLAVFFFTRRHKLGSLALSDQLSFNLRSQVVATYVQPTSNMNHGQYKILHDASNMNHGQCKILHDAYILHCVWFLAEFC